IALLSAVALAADDAPGPTAYVVAGTADGGSQLGRLNLRDGSFFLIRNYEPLFWGVTSASGSLYAVDSEGTVFKIDPETGAWTTIGSTGVPPSGPLDVSFVVAGGSSTGAFYGMDASTNLWSIDLKTGHARLVGNMGLTRVSTPYFATSLVGD